MKYTKNQKGELINDKYFGNKSFTSIEGLEDFNKQICSEANTKYRDELFKRFKDRSYVLSDNQKFYIDNLIPYYTDRCFFDIVNYDNKEISCIKIDDDDNDYYTISEMTMHSYSCVDKFEYRYHCYKNNKTLTIIDISQYDHSIVSAELRDVINAENKRRLIKRYSELNEYIKFINYIHYEFDYVHMKDIEIKKYSVANFVSLCQKYHIPAYEYYQYSNSRQYNKNRDKSIINYDIDYQFEYIKDHIR